MCVNVIADLEFSTYSVVLQIGGEQANSRRNARVGRDDDLRNVEDASDIDPMKRSRAAKRYQ